MIEQLHTDGDDYVRELATIGYREGVQFATSHVEDVSDADFEPYLGTESRRWWLGLNAFWSGKARPWMRWTRTSDPFTDVGAVVGATPGVSLG